MVKSATPIDNDLQRIILALKMLILLFSASVVAGVIWFLATPLRTGLWRFPGPWWRRYTGNQYHNPVDALAYKV